MIGGTRALPEPDGWEGCVVPPIRYAVALEQTIWGDPVAHATPLHRGARGYVALCRRTDGAEWRQRFFGGPSLLAAAAQRDTYVSQNTFDRPCRRADALRQLRTLFVDLDGYRVGLEPAASCLERSQAGEIPWPAAVLQSGRRADFLHKTTTDLAKTTSVIVVEDLSVRGMIRKRRSIADAGWGECRRMPSTRRCGTGPGWSLPHAAIPPRRHARPVARSRTGCRWLSGSSGAMRAGWCWIGT